MAPEHGVVDNCAFTIGGKFHNKRKLFCYSIARNKRKRPKSISIQQLAVSEVGTPSPISWAKLRRPGPGPGIVAHSLFLPNWFVTLVYMDDRSAKTKTRSRDKGVEIYFLKLVRKRYSLNLFRGKNCCSNGSLIVFLCCCPFSQHEGQATF